LDLEELVESQILDESARVRQNQTSYIAVSEISHNCEEPHDALELPSDQFTDILYLPGDNQRASLWSGYMDQYDVENLEPLDSLDELEDLEPVFLLKSYSNLMKAGKEDLFHTDDRGVIKISDSAYEKLKPLVKSPVGQKQDRVTKATDRVNPSALAENLFDSQDNDDFFRIPDIDLALPEDNLVSLDYELSSTLPRYNRKTEYGPVRFTHEGLDFDAFSSTFRQDDPGRLKALVTLSRLLYSRFATLVIQTERGIFYKIGLGYHKELSPLSSEDPLLQSYLKRDSITLLMNTKHYSFLMPDHEKVIGTLNQLVFLPCIVEERQGYLILGPSKDLTSPDEFIDQLKNLMTESIEAIQLVNEKK